jgi:glycosyltransferase involved in cell wall biosynthesis
MSDGPLVTAVIIFLNGEKYIAESIESILAQSYTNWELVLVDDGSTDGATDIARDYAARHPDRIRYIEHENHENRGMSASRNAGVSAGRGELVSFLDADDIWLPERLERFVEVAEEFSEAGMIYGPTLYWYSWAEERGMAPPVADQPDFEGHLDLPTETLLPPMVPLRQFLTSGGACLPGICSLMIRRSAYEDVGGFEPSFRGLYEDQVFLSKMTAHYPVVVIEEVLDYYRQHSESCCYRAIDEGEYHPEDVHPARGNYLRWLQDYCTTHGIKDRVVARAIDKQLFLYRWPILPKLINLGRRIKRVPKRLARRYLPKSVQDQIGAIKRRWYAMRFRRSMT